jgi:ABC-2 type transport system permease protein
MKKYSQLQAMLSVAKASFRSMLRSPSAIVFSIAFPLIFIIVFGFISGSGIAIDVAVKKGSDINNPIYKSLEQIKSIRLQTDRSDADIQADLEKGNLDASIDVQKNTKDSGAVFILNLKTSNAAKEKGAFVKLILNQIVDKQVIAMAKVYQPFVAINETQVKGREYKMIDFILPGQLGFSILSAGVFGTAFVFISLRQTLVIKRFFATPIKRPFIILGEMLARLVFSLLGSFIIIMIGHYAFGFTLINGAVTVINMLLLSALGLIVFMGFGFLVSGIAKNESAVPPIANIITMPQFLLAGTFFSVNNFPIWLQHVSKVLPLTYLNDAMRKIAFEGAGLTDVGLQILIIVAWGVAVYAAAVKFFRWE